MTIAVAFLSSSGTVLLIVKLRGVMVLGITFNQNTNHIHALYYLGLGSHASLKHKCIEKVMKC